MAVRGSSEPAGGGGAPTVRPEQPAPLGGKTRRLWAPGETGRRPGLENHTCLDDGVEG